MDTNETTNTNPQGEKKPRRPRIGESRTPGADQYERPRFRAPSSYTAGGDAAEGEQPSQYQRPYGDRPYQQRQYSNNRQWGYNNRQQGQQHRAYYQQQDGENAQVSAPQPDAMGEQHQEDGYQQRQGGYQQHRQYNNNRGYNNYGYNNNRQGGYNNRQGGYNNNRQKYDNRQGYQQTDGENGAYQQHDGGYRQQRPYNNNRQGGYNNNRQGGYQNNNRQGGYNNNRQGGYQSNNRQDGYNNRQGGYQNKRQQRPGGFPGKGKSFVPRPKPVEYEMPIVDPNEQIRLNKFMANAGICSRREADEFIQQGLVKVNGQVVTELGTKITHSDVVEYDEKVVALERKCYILLNKPKDCVTTSDDPNGRTTVLDLVKGCCNERIYPVGRLDRNTTGVLLLTNDGDLASKLTHPKYTKKKIYHVWTDRDIAEEDMQRIADGIELDDGEIHADAISYATETDKNQAGIEIHSGRNRIVRRIFESLGYHVTKLDRVYFAGLTKKNLPRGRWRYLTQEEVNFLKMGSFE